MVYIYANIWGYLYMDPMGYGVQLQNYKPSSGVSPIFGNLLEKAELLSIFFSDGFQEYMLSRKK